MPSLRNLMIMIYKYVTGQEEIDKEDFITHAVNRTRGHNMKLYKTREDKDARKYSFPNRVLEEWNKVPTD